MNLKKEVSKNYDLQSKLEKLEHRVVLAQQKAREFKRQTVKLLAEQKSLKGKIEFEKNAKICQEKIAEQKEIQNQNLVLENDRMNAELDSFRLEAEKQIEAREKESHLAQVSSELKQTQDLLEETSQVKQQHFV